MVPLYKHSKQTRIQLCIPGVLTRCSLYTVSTVSKPKNEFLSDTVESHSKTVYCHLRTKIMDG